MKYTILVDRYFPSNFKDGRRERVYLVFKVGRSRKAPLRQTGHEEQESGLGEEIPDIRNNRSKGMEAKIRRYNGRGSEDWEDWGHLGSYVPSPPCPASFPVGTNHTAGF